MSFTQNITKKLPEKLNRALLYKFKIDSKLIDLNVLYNKYNTLIEFQIDDSFKKDIDINIVRNLSGNTFAKKFLNFSNVEKSVSNGRLKYNVDMKNGFKSFNEGSYSYIDEYHDMCPKAKGTKDQLVNSNYVMVKGFGVTELNDSFLFLFIQRGKFIQPSNKLVVRTAAVELISCANTTSNDILNNRSG